jgi:hypothetical protein
MKDLRKVTMLAMVVLAALLLGSQNFLAQPAPSQLNHESDEAYILGRLQSALFSTRYAVRLYFHGVCDVNGEGALRFPSVTVRQPAGNEQGIRAVREMFGNNANVIVSVDSSNVIRITLGAVYRSFLDTRLPSIRLTTSARYNPDGPGGAIDLLESAAPVQAAMRELGIHQEDYFYIGLQRPALRRIPHLPSSIGGVSLDQSLDAIAKTFPGVVVYGECEDLDKKHSIDIKFDWYPSAGVPPSTR